MWLRTQAMDKVDYWADYVAPDKDRQASSTTAKPTLRKLVYDPWPRCKSTLRQPQSIHPFRGPARGPDDAYRDDRGRGDGGLRDGGALLLALRLVCSPPRLAS